MGVIFALITALCWASYNLAVRRGMQAMDSGVGYVIALFLGTAFNFAFLLLPLPGRGVAFGGWLALLFFVLAGMSTTLLGRWVYFKSISLLGPSRASAWKNASPVYTLILGILLLGERPSIMGVVGVAAVVIGLWSLSREQSGKGGKVQAPDKWRQGILLGLGSGLAFSAGMVLRKAGLNLWPDPVMGSALGALAAMAMYMPSAIKRGEVTGIARAPWAGVRAFIVAGCFSSLAQLFSFMALRVSMAASTQAITSLEPIFTMMLSALILRRQESLNFGVIGSAALVCAGVVMTTL